MCERARLDFILIEAMLKVYSEGNLIQPDEDDKGIPKHSMVT